MYALASLPPLSLNGRIAPRFDGEAMTPHILRALLGRQPSQGFGTFGAMGRQVALGLQPLRLAHQRPHQPGAGPQPEIRLVLIRWQAVRAHDMMTKLDEPGGTHVALHPGAVGRQHPQFAMHGAVPTFGRRAAPARPILIATLPTSAAVAAVARVIATGGARGQAYGQSGFIHVQVPRRRSQVRPTLHQCHARSPLTCNWPVCRFHPDA